MDISSDYSTFYYNKRAHLQRSYHYEKVILDNNILLAFYFGSSNYIHNEIYVIQEVSAGSYFYSIFTEVSFIFITIVVYLNLFHFVQSKSKVMANKTWWRWLKYKINADCNLFTIPQLTKQIILFSGVITDLRMIMDLECWVNALSYSNCCVNAVIILNTNCINPKRNKGVNCPQTSSIKSSKFWTNTKSKS